MQTKEYQKHNSTIGGSVSLEGNTMSRKGRRTMARNRKRFAKQKEEKWQA